MKKIYSMILGVAVLGTTMAQAPIDLKFNVSSGTKIGTEPIKFNRSEVPYVNQKSSSRSEEFAFWVNFTDAYYGETDSVGYLWDAPIWPDSNLVRTYNGTDYFYSGWRHHYHGAGDVLDLSSSVYPEHYDGDTTDLSGVFNDVMEYTLQAVSFSYSYAKVESNKTDTLKIYVVKESNENHTSFVSQTTGNPYPFVNYDASKNAAVGADTMITVILSQADADASTNSQTGRAWMEVPVGIDLLPGENVAVTVHYHPETDVSAVNQKNVTEVNMFNVYYVSETLADYNDGSTLLSFQYDNPVTHNQGLVTNIVNRYKLNGDILDSVYIPAYIENLFISNANPDHMQMYYLITNKDTTVTDTTTNNDTTVIDPIDTTIQDTTVIIDTTISDTTITSGSDTSSNSDTTIIHHSDTVSSNDTIIITNTDSVLITDTLYITQKDTITIRDTISITVKDTIEINNTDTVVIHHYDTITIDNSDSTVIHYYDTVTVNNSITETININIEGNCDNITTNLTEGEFDNQVSVNAYPNPVKDELTIQITNTSNIQNFTLNIYNVLGELKTTLDFYGTVNLPMNLSSFSNGLYYIEVIGEGKVLSHQAFIKE